MGRSKSKRRSQKLSAALQKRRDNLYLQIVVFILIFITVLIFFIIGVYHFRIVDRLFLQAYTLINY